MKGLSTLIALILRRDRAKLPLLAMLFVVSLLAMVPLLRDIYGDEESLNMIYATFSTNPAGLFMTGPMDAPNFGAFMTIETVLWWGLAIAFINTMLVIRHTRHNEEIGAQELLMSGQVHRSTSLTAVMLVSLAANALITVLIGLGLMLFGTGWDLEQIWLYALSFGVFGLIWASLAAIVAQLVESSRSANGIMAALIGIGFILRGVGDFLGKIGSDGLHEASWISTLSPFGWLQMTRSLVAPEWWPLGLMLVVSVVAVSVAVILQTRRDVDSGLLSIGRGRARASRLLASPFGLTLRLQKGVAVGWFVGIIVMVGTIGVLVPQLSDVYSSTEDIQRLIMSIGGYGEMMPSFMSAMIAIISLMAFSYAIHGLMRLRSEEASGHLENILASSVSKSVWLGRHVGVIVTAGIFMLMSIGAILALIVNSLSDIEVDTWQYTLSSLSYAPVLLAFVGLYVMLFGLLPRLANLISWLYFGFVAFMSWLGPILKVDQVIMNLSVMEHLTRPPGEDIQVTPLFIITVVSLLAIAVGFISWRRRNLLVG